MPNPARIVLIAAGIFVVLAATGIFFLIQRGTFSKPKPTQEQVLAELDKIHARVVRDKSSPEQPVIEIGLQTLEYDARLLDKFVVFPQLRKLDLAQTKTSDLSLEHLEKITSLQVLSLSHTKVTGGGMQFLKNMVNLEELNLAQTLVTDAGLSELKGLSKLKRLNLDGTLASGMELMAAIPGLQVNR
jgi:Leucine-rich repeat (LRR) protein